MRKQQSLCLVRCYAAVVAHAVLLFSTIAAAQQEVKPYAQCLREPTETDITAAKGAFQAGNASFDEADYPRAIVYWEDAYRRDCTAHALLLNLARAYELNGARRQASVALEGYLQRVPNSPDRDKIQRRIEVLRKQIDAEAVPPPSASPAATPVPAAAPAAPLGPAPPAVSPAVEAEPEAPSRKLPVAPLVVAGTGAALAIVGGIFYAVAWGDLKEAEKLCNGARMDCPSSVADEGQSARIRVNVSGVVTVGGLALTGGGLAWFFLVRRNDRRIAERQTPRVVPLAAPGFAGLAYHGSF